MKRFFKDLMKYFRYALYSARSELKAEVADSYLNWIWWVLEPTAFMFIYTFIFGTVFNAREPFFPIFIFIGLSGWEFFSRNLHNSVKIVKANKAIVSKVYLPKFILLVSKMMVNGFKMMVSFGIVAGMILFYRVPITLNILYFIPILIVLVILTFGFMTILMHFGVFVDDLYNLIHIGLKLVFYLTGIFFQVQTRVPAPWGDWLAKGNPMALIITSMRNVLIYGQTPNFKFLFIWFVIGVIITSIGIRLIYNNENIYVKVI